MRSNKILRGIAASPGMSLKRAFTIGKEDLSVPEFDITDTDKEAKRLKEALKYTKEELNRVKNRIEKRADPYSASMFDAQLFFLNDEEIIEKTLNIINKTKKNAEYALKRAVYGMSLSTPDSPFFRERWREIEDVLFRVIRNMEENRKPLAPVTIEKDCNVIAHDIPSSDMILLDGVGGIITERGGKTSHTAILARALGIPAVVGVEHALKHIRNGDFIILDGVRGVVIINPDEDTLKSYAEKIKRFGDYMNGLVNLATLPPTTIDGHSIEVSANIELPMEIDCAMDYGAQGIGLFRTEFFFLDRIPTEDEQFKVYKYCAEAIKPNSLIIRTMDIGGDKLFNEDYKEQNPFLGWRAIRIYKKHRQILRTQLRAILKASTSNNVRVMFPMVTSIEEIKLLKREIKKTKRELDRENIRYDNEIEIGIMVEVPSAAILARDFAREVNFFSIGSNDLTQYTLACDRGNQRVADIFNPLHPAVIRLMKDTIDAGHSQDIWVGLCGELGRELIAVPLLIGLGIDELSVSPRAILPVKSIIRRITTDECHDIASKVLSMSSVVEVEKYLTSTLESKLGTEEFLINL